MAYSQSTGPVVPGFGELLVDTSVPPFHVILAPATGTKTKGMLAIPFGFGLVDASFATQALVVDSGRSIQLTDAVDITIGL